MQTLLADFIRDTPAGREADRILRACVHCGFCTATCPTYQLLGDELDGPRGRIYLIKQVLEGEHADVGVRTHLDRCLACRSCETTCPSGVNYHRLLDIGRETVEQQAPRSWLQRLQRRMMIEVLAYRSRFTPLIRLGRLLRPLMPGSMRRSVPIARPALPRAVRTSEARGQVIVLDGCVQPGLAPEINQALALLLARLGIEIAPTDTAGCCGAVPQHLIDSERAVAMAKRNIDAWLPALDDGAQALLVTASGCGAQVKDYPALLAHDPDYADKARRLADAARDPIDFLQQQALQQLRVTPRKDRVAVHTPCTLQHALHLNGRLEQLLTGLGYTLCEVREGHLCCGSAGTYSMFQPEISAQLRTRKLQALEVDRPDLIVTANIGCMLHLDETDGTPVRHWLNVVAEDLNPD